MGIRYYGLPIAAEHHAIALANPRFFLCCSEVYDHWLDDDPGRRDEPRLDLDKAFNVLGALFRPRSGSRCMAAFGLVSGSVEFTSCGWRPHYGVLSAEEVAIIARELGSTTLEELVAGADEPAAFDDDLDYLGPYFAAAQTATAAWAGAGRGALYSIG
jgi:hypothetical protein